MLAFSVLMAAGLVYIAVRLTKDLSLVHSASVFPYVLLGLALLIALVTILGADNFGLPVSTTHVLSSGVAGTMAANGSGLQWSTVRNIAMAWIFTLLLLLYCPAACFGLSTQWSGSHGPVFRWPPVMPGLPNGGS